MKNGHPVELREVLEGIDQGRANALLEAFNMTALSLGVDIKTAQWAVAMLQASILARAPFGEPQMHVAAEFGKMVQAALPAAMLAIEKAERSSEGLPPNDA